MFPFKTALNASTLFPFKLDIRQQVRTAAEAGYEGIEIWVRDVDAYLSNGGTIRELKRHIDDTGIPVVNAIAFFKWADADDAERAKGLKQAEREMIMLAELGCTAVAAPPFGNVGPVTLNRMAAHYAELSDLAKRIGVDPYLEFWGRAQTLSKLHEAVYVAMESGVPDAKLLLDPFHMYTGGSGMNGLRYLNGGRIGIVHVNDYPAAPAREAIADRDRVFPGEGSAPSRQLASSLYEIGYSGYLSLELFIESFGVKSAIEVAKMGLDTIFNTYRL
ncbi:sugar phosphate isomerase/epimerase family protein [Paenibacillus piri]|uniref:Sugar phosphate isomerase/epimerase n=1 Tax=Paenibacillus piri TaxID=2547395 RepID=A0A4R5KSD0_9BACL|nr:sugar phosphate isomerase/epimerase family protein [Paenibacillus piri]TDF98763.1 sugar phosphate isomerase/epimerase [Paenibacillus piri]